MFRLPALPGPSVACSGSRPPVVFRRVPARSGVPVDLRPDLSSQLPVHGTLSARRETGTSDLGVEHQPPETWASGQANYAWRPRLQKQEFP